MGAKSVRDTLPAPWLANKVRNEQVKKQKDATKKITSDLPDSGLLDAPNMTHEFKHTYTLALH